MERIGLLGGTFNPVHNGHLHLARGMAACLSLSRVVLIPARLPPHKPGGEAAPAAARLEMCRLAAADDPFLAVSDVEIARGGTSYTVDTLRELTERLPGAVLFFIMGADMFLTLEKWKHFERIARLAELCAAVRGGTGEETLREYAERLKTRYGARCHIESIPEMRVSSTQIRSLIASGGDASPLLPPRVYRYICKNGLYTGKPAAAAKELQ